MSEKNEGYVLSPSLDTEKISQQAEIPEAKATIFDLYRSSTLIDYGVLLVSAVCALIAGATRVLPSVSRKSCGEDKRC